MWTGEVTPDGALVLDRTWRGVLDHHLIEATFVASAEARKLAGLAAEQADAYRDSRRA